MDPKHLVSSAALALLAGFVDGFAFVMLGGFFVSFMSGNTTQASAELTGGAWGAAGYAGLLVAAFVAGGVTGTAVSIRARSRGVMTLVALMLLVAAVLAGAGHAMAAGPVLAAAMGATNAPATTPAAASTPPHRPATKRMHEGTCRSSAPLAERTQPMSAHPWWSDPRLAERVGFEPTEGCPSHAFQACRFGRSRTSPEVKTRARTRRRRPGDLRHSSDSAESCCLPALTRFTGCGCTGPGRHLRVRTGPR